MMVLNRGFFHSRHEKFCLKKKKEYIFNLVHARPRSSSLNQPQFSWSSKAWTLAPQKYAQGRFGVLKEIVVSDKCSSTALSVYKGSILELRYIPVTKCGWECEQCSHTFFGHFQDVGRCVFRNLLNAKWRRRRGHQCVGCFRYKSSPILFEFGHDWN